MQYLPIFACALAGFGVTLLSIPLILRVRVANWGSRNSDLHHAHKAPTPRLGGLALVISFALLQVLGAVFFPESQTKVVGLPVMIISSLAMFLLGFIDDLHPVGAHKKLLGQILISLAVVLCGIGIQQFKVPFSGTIVELKGWGAIVTVVWLVGMTNLINLIDGVDGLAGGIALMLMVLLVYVGHGAGYDLQAAGMAGALLAFLRFNFPPARVYMGDGGAYFLGFQIGMLSLLCSHKGTVLGALSAPLFVLALPIVDTCLTVLRRGLRGLPVLRPDRRHLHHHLMDMGLSRRRVVLSFYGVTLVFLLMGFAAFWSRGELVPVLLGLSALVLLFCAGILSFSREWFAVGRVLGNSLAMREEIRYALSLTRLLAHEGGRCGTVDELWSCLIYTARRLGFTAVGISLRDGSRVWDGSPDGVHLLSRDFQVRGGKFGKLEVKAPQCPRSANLTCASCPGCSEPRSDSCVCLREPRVFAIIGELLAEGWASAAASWCRTRRSEFLLELEPAIRDSASAGRKGALTKVPSTPAVVRASN